MVISLLNNIKINYLQKKNFLIIPKYKYNSALLNILLEVGYIKNFYIKNDKLLILLYKNYNKLLKIYYKPSNKILLNCNLLKKLMSNKLHITAVLSTNKKLLTHKQALNLRCGGLLLFIIY